MSLFCDSGYDHDGADWWWYQPADEAPLITKRSRKCCSCGEKVGVGDTAVQGVLLPANALIKAAGR
jgi:hypothetical protein